ncbi:uroporphyrinogen-III C-methyltransferase [Sessilibacter corallicola]|uniref:uroporphyrinogen-III C-methyltransferase n=1 Tax=Sessilibacter corallicola TaxID=2904075 RepID=UPI001E2877E8|nr:uroporphyrinogen-III C-methyltransferase [Sessilibacter corallicola]MCE2027764.1 uroporphyrinogen-III C-methyltransferase [Sessilibacter corallicola]
MTDAPKDQNESPENTPSDSSPQLPNKTSSTDSSPTETSTSNQHDESKKADPETLVAEPVPDTSTVSDKNSKASSKSTDSSQVEPKSEPKQKSAASHKPAKKSRFTGVFLSLLFLLVIGLIAAAGFVGYWFYPQWQQQAEQVVSLRSEIQQRDGEVKRLEQSVATLNQQLKTQASQSQSTAEALTLSVEEVTQRLNTHNERLLSLSNTSREDWLLAEAHYLVRLASQRILIDQNVQSALGLMEAADAILRDLSLPDLFPVRQALARDLAAIRLAAEVDREGIYLRLQGLAETVSVLPTHQLPEALRSETTSLSVENDTTEEPASDNLWNRVSEGVSDAAKSFGQYFQIQHHDEPVAPLLPPSASEYLRQNLRFSIEQAQLAMLREEKGIYTAALNNAKILVETYFPQSNSAGALISELDYLSQLEIIRTLPAVNNSQQQLQAYIEKLHKLGSQEASSAEPELEEDEQ